jgi:hypothetical protein
MPVLSKAEGFEVVLGGKKRRLPEPVFGQLRRIIPLYNALPKTQDDQAAGEIVLELLRVLFGAQKLGRVSGPELAELLRRLPDICGFETGSHGKGDSDGSEFGYLYAHLAASFGWTYDYIDRHMTLRRFRECEAYWEKHPPTHWLAAAYLGYEGPRQQTAQQFFASLLATAKVASD